MNRRTRAYWPTRILLAVGFLATVTMLALTLVVLLAQEPMFAPPAGILGLPVGKVITLVGLLSAVVGFAWMLRIFRGPRDAPAVWRYRDR